MEDLSLDREMKWDEVMKGIDPEKVVAYIHSRECPSGGFCFYGLDEPNLADTFFAAQTLSLLSSAPLAPERTVALVRRFLQASPGEGSLWGIYYALRVLDLYQQDIPSLPQVQEVLLGFLEKRAAMSKDDSGFGLELLCHMVDLMALHGSPMDAKLKSAGQQYVLQFQYSDGGFGSERSNLWETSFAVRILESLGYPLETLGVHRFARDCEHREFGFCTLPGSSPAFMEDIYRGLIAFRSLGLKARYPTAIMGFIRDCQTESHGFRRSRWLGIPTLEYTYMAIESLHLIHAMDQEEDRASRGNEKDECTSGLRHCGRGR